MNRNEVRWTTVSNASSSELRVAVERGGVVAACARRELERRVEAERWLSRVVREVAAEQAAR